MKKSLIALAVMAFAGAASAQSSVTLFGIVDATLSYGSAGGPGGSHVTKLSNSGYNSSRLGFRGTEDLGGGLAASFWLEAGMNNDDGSGSNTNLNNQTTGTSTATAGTQGLTFNRRSTVSLSGNWGELRLGRDYNPSFWNLTVFDPFGTNGVGTSLGLSGAQAATAGTGANQVIVRTSNAIGYFAPANLGGFYGQIGYWLGENQSTAANSKDGTGYGFRAGYAAGPFNAALGYSRTRYAQLAGNLGGDYRTWNLGGQWDFGMARLMAQFGKDRREAIVAQDGRQWLLGVSVPVGPGEIRASYSSYRLNTNGLAGTPRADKLALGYVHNLSKRTALYASIAHLRNRDGAALALNGSTFGAGVVNANSNGWDLGIRHSF